MKNNVEDGTVLIIDDEPELIRIVGTILRQAGFPTVATTDPEKAVQFVQTDGSIKLILSDVSMPNVSGPELIRRALRLRDDVVQVAFMSGTTSHADVRRTDKFLRKPFTFETLADQVRSAMHEPLPPLPWGGPERRRHAGFTA